MLSNLFGSRARVKILKIFLLNPDQKYYIRQLSRDLKLQVNSVRRELENLEKFGILVSGSVIASSEADKAAIFSSITGKITASDDDNEKHDKKYFKAHADFVLFEEIKSLIIKAQILYGEDFFNKLKKIGSIKLLIFLGKFVNDPSSPVDLFVVGRINKIRLLRLIKELERELGREINFTYMDMPEFKYRREITDIFLYGILENKKIIAVDQIGLT